MTRAYQSDDLSVHIDDLAAINAIATVVGQSLELDEVLTVALDTILGLFGIRSGGIYLVEKPGARLKLHTHRNLTKAYLKEKTDVAWAEGCTGQAVITGELYSAFDHPEKTFVCKDSERLMGIDCLVAAPLKSKGDVVGVLELFAPTSRRLTEREARILNSISSQIGVAVDNAMTYREVQATVKRLTALQKELTGMNRKLEAHLREESYIARALQKGLLPADIPELETLDIGRFYASATKRASIGGDFYDVFRLDGDRYVFVVGDVCGKGVEVAAQASAVRYSVRSYLAAYNDPGKVLELANRTLITQRSLELFATAFLAVVQTDTLSLRYSSAGHPPPILYQASDKQVERLSPGGPALGIGEGSLYPSFEATLGAGDLVAIFTDGLSDARLDGKCFGSAGIAEAVRHFAGGDAQTIADAVARRCLKFARGELQDDIALLVLKGRAGSGDGS